MTKLELKKLSIKKRIRLLKNLIDSFDSAVVTGLYASEADITSKQIYQGKGWNHENKPILPKSNSIIISTDLTTG